MWLFTLHEPVLQNSLCFTLSLYKILGETVTEARGGESEGGYEGTET